MNRFLVTALLLAAATVCGAPKRHAAANPPEKPNIVLLISDDDDYENFGFMGNAYVQTPTLDRLVAAGTLFTNTHCPAPLCRPSLASILSGRMPHQHGIYANYLEQKGIGNDTTKLDPKNSLANRLKDAGYATYATAKYWEGDSRVMGFTHGTVDVTFKGFGGLVRNGQDELFEFIDKTHEEKPMFIWWTPLLPHNPHNPPPKYADRFTDTPITIPAYYNGDREKYIEEVRKFYAMGTWFDDGVAQLIRKLKDAGEYENTIFLFYVDNGYTYGQPAKNSPTEKGLRTPMFVTWPGRVPTGKRIAGLNYAIDLHATILDYANLSPTPGITSQSLRPLIEGRTDRSHDALYGAVYAHAPANYQGDPSVPRSAQRDVYALYVRTERWKYVLYTQDLNEGNDRYIWMVHQLCDPFTRAKGEDNLFDLKVDPYEMDNLADRPGQKKRVAEFRKQVLNWWRQTGGKPIPGLMKSSRR
ncbi:MAG: sulfatase-like hydrolase/transferase [Planctomycetes bacterium]|nr:sulfatase-like hydrolase/transferase [Planctomycetota bacterium]